MNMDSDKEEGKENFIKCVSEINNDIQLILDCDSLVKIVEDANDAING